MNMLRRAIRRHEKMKRRALILNGEDVHTHCFSQNLRNYPLYSVIQPGSLVRWIGLLFHYNRTAPELNFNQAETTSFRRSRTDCFGADPSTIAVFTYVQTNRAMGVNVPGSETMGQVWKQPNSWSPNYRRWKSENCVHGIEKHAQT